MLKNKFWVVPFACFLSFSTFAEPTENQLYPNYGQTSGRVVEQYPYTQLPTQVYPNSRLPQDYYPYGQQSTQIYYGQREGCGCQNKYRYFRSNCGCNE